MALLSPEELESMRSEIKEALESENGWTKGAIDKMVKIDSALREVGRYYGLVHCGLCSCVWGVRNCLYFISYIEPGSNARMRPR